MGCLLLSRRRLRVNTMLRKSGHPAITPGQDDANTPLIFRTPQLRSAVSVPKWMANNEPKRQGEEGKGGAAKERALSGPRVAGVLEKVLRTP